MVCALSGCILCSPGYRFQELPPLEVEQGLPRGTFLAGGREAWSCLWVTLRGPGCWTGIIGWGVWQIGAYKALNRIKDDRGEECSINPVLLSQRRSWGGDSP